MSTQFEVLSRTRMKTPSMTHGRVNISNSTSPQNNIQHKHYRDGKRGQFV